MYDSYGLELCTMYDSYDVYLRVLWTIYMYTISIYHIVVFTGFFIPFTDFRQKNHSVSGKNRPEIATPIFGKIADLSVKSAEF
jgi:hypothetical protein